MAEDTVAPAGTLVRSLLAGGAVADADYAAKQGIAVTFLGNTSQGTWQYTLDGTNWKLFGTLAATSPLLLPADSAARIRFVPRANFNGVARIYFRAWDQTTGIAGETADLSRSGATGGRTAFSDTSRYATIQVTPRTTLRCSTFRRSGSLCVSTKDKPTQEARS